MPAEVAIEAGMIAGALEAATPEVAMTDVEARPSPIAGLGLFALRDFAEGEAILVRREREVTAQSPLRTERGE